MFKTCFWPPIRQGSVSAAAAAERRPEVGPGCCGTAGAGPTATAGHHGQCRGTNGE
jgi:hypothetical protein